MKTDRFTDIIRRKLESIRPEFTDKDWARMQATLKDANLSQPNVPDASHPFSGGVWSSGKSWLLAAASVSTVVLITYGFWQQREINQLRQTIGQLQRHPANQSASTPKNPDSAEQVRPNVAHSDAVASSTQTQKNGTLPNRNEGQSERPDTVYITRYVAVPARPKPDARAEERVTQRLETPTDQRYNPAFSESLAFKRQSTAQNKDKQTESYDASSTSSVAQNTHNGPVKINESTNSAIQNERLVSQNTRGKNKKQRSTSPSNSFATTNDGSVNNGGAEHVNNRANTNVVPTGSTGQTDSSASANELSAHYELAASLPLSLENKNWGAALAQRAKRIRPARPTVVIAEPEQTQTPASQTVQHVATRFRAGIGGEVAARLWSVGAFTEILFGRHWALGVGINQATYLNRFITEDDFNARTHRNFRKDFARPGDNWRDILNIDTRQVRLQIPVSLGYRIPLNQSLSLLPTVGTYLNLSNSENITYYCRDIQRPPMQPQIHSGVDEISTRKGQPVNLINTLAIGTGIEWQQGHWVAQASPIVTLPLQNSLQEQKADLNWQKNTTVGLRARLLYQF